MQSRSFYFKKVLKFKLSFDARLNKDAETFFSGFETPQTKEGCHKKGDRQPSIDQRQIVRDFHGISSDVHKSELLHFSSVPL